MKIIKKYLDKLKYNFGYLNIFFTPLKAPRLKFYFGEVAIGLPYSLPVKLRKLTIEEQEREVKKYLLKNPRTTTLEKAIKYASEIKKRAPVRFSFDLCSLGWKTKFNQIRFEWDPVISITLFGKQLAITICSPSLSKVQVVEDVYWETYLYYVYRTDKRTSAKDRLNEVFKQYSGTWVSYDVETNTTTSKCHFYDVLKKKYHYLIKDEPVELRPPNAF